MGYTENCNRCIHSCVCNGEKYGRDECGEFSEEVKHGKWIVPEDEEEMLIAGVCSVCGWESKLYETDVVGMNYCPNCGAKMDLN